MTASAKSSEPGMIFGKDAVSNGRDNTSFESCLAATTHYRFPLAMDPEQTIRELQRGGVQLISPSELRAKLQEGRPLRVKLGVDPTAPDLHLGHSIGLS